MLTVRDLVARPTGDVGGSEHNIGMRTYEMCERCFGSGADPVQPFASAPDEITFCIECFGEGCVEMIVTSGDSSGSKTAAGAGDRRPVAGLAHAG